MLLVACVFGFSQAFSQVMMNETPVDYTTKKYGPNFRHHVALVINSAYLIPDSETASGADALRSVEWGIGLRYKLKLTNIIHFNTHLSYSYSRYKFNDAHFIPGVGYSENFNVLNSGFNSIEETWVKYQAIELSPTFRFRLSKGNNIGWFVDVGGFGKWTFAHQSEIHGDQVRYGDMVMASNMDPDEYFNYGYMGRVGWNVVSLYFKHRLNQQYDNLNLSPYSAGLEIILNFNGQ